MKKNNRLVRADVDKRSQSMRSLRQKQMRGFRKILEQEEREAHLTDPFQEDSVKASEIRYTARTAGLLIQNHKMRRLRQAI